MGLWGLEVEGERNLEKKASTICLYIVRNLLLLQETETSVFLQFVVNYFQFISNLGNLASEINVYCVFNIISHSSC